MTFSITRLCHFAECHYTEFHILFIVAQNFIMQSVVVLNVAMQCHCVNVVMQSVIVLNVIMLNVIMLSVMAPILHLNEHVYKADYFLKWFQSYKNFFVQNWHSWGIFTNTPTTTTTPTHPHTHAHTHTNKQTHPSLTFAPFSIKFTSWLEYYSLLFSLFDLGWTRTFDLRKMRLVIYHHTGAIGQGRLLLKSEN